MKDLKQHSALNNCLRVLGKAQAKYDGAIGGVEELLSNYVDFEFGIVYQPSDGFVIVDYDANNAPVRDCLGIIREKGTLSHEDYRSVCI